MEGYIRAKYQGVEELGLGEGRVVGLVIEEVRLGMNGTTMMRRRGIMVFLLISEGSRDYTGVLTIRVVCFEFCDILFTRFTLGMFA
jgi:hypothetical protein